MCKKAAQLNNNQHPALLFYVCVSFRCDGKKVCELSVTDVQSPDPCVDTYKYLETSYTCLPASQYHMTMKLWRKQSSERRSESLWLIYVSMLTLSQVSQHI